MAWEKAIFMGCSHGELVDRKAVKVFQRFMADWNPKHRVHLGDIWDFAALRNGASAEERKIGIKYDYNCGLELLDWYQPQYLTLGNHDDRIWEGANRKSDGPLSEALRDLCDDAESEFRKRRIQWIPYDVDCTLKLPCGGPEIFHGFQSTIYPARSAYDAFGSSISAHCHVPTTYQARNIKKDMAMTVGTMADLKKLTYAKRHTAKLGWRNSFAYTIHNTKTGYWEGWHVVKQPDGSWLSPHGIL